MAREKVTKRREALYPIIYGGGGPVAAPTDTFP